jgi:hypothetical protein
LLVVPSRVYKWSINPISNPKLVYSHNSTHEIIHNKIVFVFRTIILNKRVKLYSTFCVFGDFYATDESIKSVYITQVAAIDVARFVISFKAKLIPWNRVLLENLIVAQLDMKLLHLY